MKYFLRIAPLIGVLLAAPTANVSAQSAQADMPSVQLPRGKSRAEVQADLIMWRRSGLAGLQGTYQTSQDFESLEYRRAKARYEALIASPQFTQLVEQLGRSARGSVAVVTSQ